MNANLLWEQEAAGSNPAIPSVAGLPAATYCLRRSPAASIRSRWDSPFRGPHRPRRKRSTSPPLIWTEAKPDWLNRHRGAE